MVELQIISKLIETKNDTFLKKNNIDKEYFQEYQDEFNFIVEHQKEFGNIPDEETFREKFQDVDLIQVRESEEYLVSTIQEEYTYYKFVPLMQKISELTQTDSREAFRYLKSNIEELQVPGIPVGIDIVQQAYLRLEEYEDMKNNPAKHFIPTGFKELDEMTGGWHCGEEFGVIFARTGQGKSWILIKMLEHSWKMNKRVALLEPEMSASKTGYRFDTVHSHISNTAMTRGNDIRGYNKYINNLQTSEIPFLVTHPKDFNKKVTVSKLKEYCIANKVDILGIDGISYLTDERAKKGDNRTTELTHISEDIMDLSIDLSIPVLVICQSNRAGAKEDELGTENIRDSDGIGYNASQILAIKQKDGNLEIVPTKARNARTGVKLTYTWNIDLGQFEYIPTEESGIDDSEESEQLRRRYSKESEGEF